MSTQRRVRIALDVMGGDHAPANEIMGALAALQSLSPQVPEIVLVGDREVVERYCRQSGTKIEQFEIVHASEVVTMDDEPAVAFKKKKDTSLHVGLRLVAEKRVDAFVSAGNTGAVMSFATLILGRIPGVSRPTIGTFLPTYGTRPVLLLDVGANVDSKPKYLYEYAVMGSIYSQQVWDIPSPTVGLLNVGEEKTKGNEVTLAAHELLEAGKINFHGNVEGRDILAGKTDVVVCDGFTGNIVLKFAESMVVMLRSRIRRYAERGLLYKMILLAFKPVLKSILSKLDYQEYGGVPLLGVRGVVIIGHGSSTPMAIKNMIARACEVVQKDVNGAIEAALRPTTPDTTPTHKSTL